MAFSTFRGFIGAAGNTPAAYSDTFTPTIPAVAITSTGSFASQDLNFCPAATSNTVYAATTNGSNGEVYIMTANNSYVTAGSKLSLTTPTAIPTGINIAQIDANNAIVVYRATTTTCYAQVINNSSGTLSASVGETLVLTSGSTLNIPLVCALDTGNALVLGFNGSVNANNRMSLVNASSLAAIQSNTSASSINMTATNAAMLTVNSTRAAVIFLTGAFLLQIATVDVVSGTSFTLYSPVSSGVTSVTGMVGFASIDSSTILVAYYKSSNTLGVRTVTIGSGGSVTYNTEYTFTANGLASAPQQISIAAYSATDYVITYAKQYATPGNNTGDGFEAIGVRVTGTVVAFSTSGASVLFQGAKFLNNYRGGQTMRASQMSSGNVMIGFPTFVVSIGAVPYLTALRPNQTPLSWSGFDGTKNSGVQSVANTASVSGACWLGLNRMIVQLGATALRFTSFAGGTSTKALIGNASTNAAVQTQNNYALLAYDTTNALERILATYVSTTNTITTYVGSMTSGGSAYTVNTTTTFTATGVNSTNCGLVPIDGNSALFIYSDGTTNLQARRIDTSGITISSTNSDQNIFTNGRTIQTGTRNFQYAVIDSTRVAILVATSTAGVAPYALDVFIVSISGGTLTGGTPVNVFSGYTNNVSAWGITVFPNSSTGIITYTGDASTLEGLNAYGFTYSGSTITLGTTNSLATGLTVISNYSGSNYSNRSMVSVSNNEAIYLYAQGSAGSSYDMRLLTYNNINSVSTGTLITAGTVSSSAYLFFDSTNQMVVISRQIAAATQDTTFFYRD